MPALSRTPVRENVACAAGAAQLVLRVFLALLPTILALLGRAEGLPAESEVEFTVVKRYYAFQVRLIWPLLPAWTTPSYT